MPNSACICHIFCVYLGMKNKDKTNNMRDYTVNNDLTIEHGEVHEHKGKKYTRSYIGRAAFDNEVGGWKKGFNEMMGLWKNDRKAYYKKYEEK